MGFVSVVLNILAVLLLVALNGFFVAAEFAIVKVRATQIEPLARSGLRRARTAEHVIKNLDTYLSASQLGITMTSLGLGWIGEPAVARMIEPVLSLAGVTSPAVVSTVAFAFGFTFITTLHIILGEQAPKWLAIQRAQKTTLLVSPSLHLFYSVFRPFIWVLNAGANYFVRLVGIEPGGESELVHSEEELRVFLSKGRVGSAVSKAISLRAMELKERTVREVMVPRPAIVFLTTEKSLEDNISAALEQQFTRYPLCEGAIDNVAGMIHLKDLFRLKGEHAPGTKLLDIKREILFVPETTALEKLLNLFLSKRILMAIAVDEYGGTAGLITLENVLEELVGEIDDEFDSHTLMVQKIAADEFMVDGSMPLHDFARVFDMKPDTRDVVTVSGYAIQLLGRVPEKGASLRIEGWMGLIEAVEGRRVRTLRLKRIPPESPLVEE
jgi:CBS domain containing-hemolysin-like protein